MSLYTLSRRNQVLKNRVDLEGELHFLGLLDKAREIQTELGDKAVLSYIRSSYRLLSKVYHPDLNPKNRDKAKITQQRLNRLSSILSQMKDEELIEVIKKGVKKSSKRKKKILIVEDEFGLQEIFRDIFLMEGYDVRIAVDGIDGYKIYCQFGPDLVFTDVMMPKMNGLELVRKIRKVNPHIKVIYISGFFGIKELKQELDEDILRYGYPTLSKPFKASQMLDLVKKYLEGC
jgi:CheY-like chemotaxis protein